MNEHDFFLKYDMPPYAMFAVLYNANKENALNVKGCEHIMKDLINVYTQVNDQDKLLDLFFWLNPDIVQANEQIKQAIGPAIESDDTETTSGR